MKGNVWALATNSQKICKLGKDLAEIHFIPAGFEQHTRKPHSWAVNYANNAGQFLLTLPRMRDLHQLATRIEVIQKASAIKSSRGVQQIRHGNKSESQKEITNAREFRKKVAKMRGELTSKIERAYGDQLVQAVGEDAGGRGERSGRVANWFLQHHQLLRAMK